MPSGCVRRLCLPLDSDQPVDGDLIFDASFESANLGKVERVSAIEWNVYIRSDLCSPKHALWYYFTVTNAMAEQTVLFNIHGLCKTRSLLRDGMAPVVRTSSGLWQRMPASNTFYHQPEPGESKTYISSFVYQFADDNDVVEFAYCYPYSYSDMQAFLRAIVVPNAGIVQQSTLCLSLQGRDVPLLTICSPVMHERLQDLESLPSIMISARVHPGETPASYLCEGLLRFLCSNEEQAEQLRDTLVIKVVPMLNVDGVVHGQYRCNLKGHDLNRCWRSPTTDAQPTIHAVKQHLSRTRLETLAYVDLHAHSTNASGFMYGNAAADSHRAAEQWLLPNAIARRNPTFSTSRTKFNNDKDKTGTGRRAVGSVIGAGHSYTFEVSFYGYTEPDKLTLTPFTQRDYIQLGMDLGRALDDTYGQRVRDSEHIDAP